MNGGTNRGFTDPGGAVGGVRVPIYLARQSVGLNSTDVIAANVVNTTGAMDIGSPVLAAATPTVVLSLTGRGLIDVLAAYIPTACAVTLEIDGVAVLRDPASSTGTRLFVGQVGNNVQTTQPLYFESSVRVILTASAGLTAHVAARYELHK